MAPALTSGQMCSAKAASGLGSASMQAVLDHQPGAGMPFLARLEHEFDGPGELVAMAVQQMHRLHQHRGMRVMAAGMHAARDLAGEVEPGFLRHRQRVHVAAQQDRAPGLRSRLGAAQRHDEPRG